MEQSTYQFCVFAYDENAPWVDKETGKSFYFYAGVLSSDQGIDQMKKFLLEVIKPQYENVFRMTLTPIKLKSIKPDYGSSDVHAVDRTSDKIVIFERGA